MKHGKYYFIYTIRDEKITFKTNLRKTDLRMSASILMSRLCNNMVFVQY